MRKIRTYPDIKVSVRAVRKIIEACRNLASKKEDQRITGDVWVDNDKWSFENLEDFFVSYADERAVFAHLTIWWDGMATGLSLMLHDRCSDIGITNDSRSAIEGVLAVLDETTSDDRISLKLHDPDPEVVIFIGHGRDPQWEKLKSHLQDKHDLDVISYETGARAGHTIRDILDSMSEESSFALLVLTGEDKSEDGLRARQNVIHECGLFQGCLGFDRAIMLVEDGVKLASNFDGIQQLRFKKGRISEVFGDVLATIRREFGPL